LAKPSKLASMSVEALIKLRDDIGKVLAARSATCKVSLPPLVRVVGCRVRRPSVVPEEAR
jgi:hypothetical protein